MGATTLRFSNIAEVRRCVAALGRRTGLGHVLHHDVAGGEAADQQRPWLRIMGPSQSSLMQSVGRGTRAGLLAESEVHAADNLALLVEILERGLHLAIEQHPAVDLDALFPVEIFRFANGRDRSAEVAADLIADRVAFANLANAEDRFFQAVVGDGVGALRWTLGMRIGARCTTVWTVRR